MERNYVFKGGITKYWWISLVTGLLAVGIGIWCLCSPADSLMTLAYVFAALMCAAGVINLSFGFANMRFFPAWGWSVGMGILELICGIWMLCLPEPVITLVFIYVVGFYLIFAAINAICASCTVYSFHSDWFGWILAILLVTLLFAVIFMAGPIVGGIAVWFYIGISFICFGIYRMVLAFQIRKINRKIRF